MRENTTIKLTAIVAITILEAINLFTIGIDTALFSLCIAVIAGIGGYHLGKNKILKLLDEKGKRKKFK